VLFASKSPPLFNIDSRRRYSSFALRVRTVIYIGHVRSVVYIDGRVLPGRRGQTVHYRKITILVDIWTLPVAQHLRVRICSSRISLPATSMFGHSVRISELLSDPGNF
jgi:hypothetical protein